MSRKTPINLYVGEHHFSFTVTEKEEELLRKATVLLNNRIKRTRKETHYEEHRNFAVSALLVIAELLGKLDVEGEEVLEQQLEDIKRVLEDSILFRDKKKDSSLT